MNRDEYYIALEENKACLQHHGIQGQKWGLRRYQNPDGTLTPAGRERYLNSQRTYYNIATREKRSLVRPTVGAMAISGVGTAALGGPVGLAVGLSGLATLSVNALLNRTDSNKMRKAENIMTQYREMYGDTPVDSITKSKAQYKREFASQSQLDE